MEVFTVSKLLDQAPYSGLVELFELTLSEAYASRDSEDFEALIRLACKIANRASIMEPELSARDIGAAQALVEGSVLRAMLAFRPYDEALA